MRKFKEAITDYKKAIELDNSSQETYFRLGLCFMELKQNSNAIEMFDKVIKLNQTFVDAYYNKGLCLSKLGRFEEAIFNYNFILSYDRKNLIKFSDISVCCGKATCKKIFMKFIQKEECVII